MIQLLQITIDVFALALLVFSVFCLGMAAALEAVKHDARKMKKHVESLHDAYSEFTTTALDTIEHQRRTIDILMLPQPREFDRDDKFY
jgi:outer membrane lipoprotein-sorting protein